MKKLFFIPLALTFVLLLSGQALAADKVQEPLKPIKEIFEPTGNYPKEQFLKIAVIQNKQRRGVSITDKGQIQKYKTENIKELESYIRKASDNGATFIITPEYGIVGYPNTPDYVFKKREEVVNFVEAIPGATTEFFSRLAIELQVYISVNMLEVDPTTTKYFNTQVIVSPEGKIMTKHRKFNLFETEAEYLSAGETETIMDTPWGRVGILTCADTYQILLLYKYLGKVDHLFVSASWTKNNSGWNYFKAASALTKTNYVVSNQHFFPDSGVINSDGTEQSHIRQTEGIAYGYLKYKK